MVEASASIALGDGVSAKVWIDCWLPVWTIRSFAPHLFGTVSKRYHSRTVREALIDVYAARSLSWLEACYFGPDMSKAQPGLLWARASMAQCLGPCLGHYSGMLVNMAWPDI
jgi:hypothetical protein